MQPSLKGKVAAVYGASSGMGLATALALGEAGVDVALLARTLGPMEEAAATIRLQGARAEAFGVDLRDSDAARDSVRRVLERFEQIDILVYATGWNIPARALELLSREDWDTMQRTNLWGLYDVAQAALPALRASRARVVVISSAAVQMPDVSGVAYQAAKHAEAGFAFGMMKEEAKNGLRVTVIYPGLTDTPMLGRRPTPTAPELVAQALQPGDVAQAVVFAVSLPDRAYVAELTLLPAAIQQR